MLIPNDNPMPHSYQRADKSAKTRGPTASFGQVRYGYKTDAKRAMAHCLTRNIRAWLNLKTVILSRPNTKATLKIYPSDRKDKRVCWSVLAKSSQLHWLIG